MAVETLPETPAEESTSTYTLADLIDQLDGVPPDRIRLRPTPGTATEAQLVAINEGKYGLCELIDGTLVEKAVGIFESVLAAVLIRRIGNFLAGNRIGFVFGADAMFRMVSSNIRLPDVAFLRSDRFPGGKVPRIAVAEVPIDLAVEIKSPTNTWKELERKGREFFESGTRLYWIADPESERVRVYESMKSYVEKTVDDELDGAEVLPGFRLSIREWFAEAENAGAS